MTPTATPPALASGDLPSGRLDPTGAAELLRALANPWRLEIVRLLATEDLDVTTLAKRLGLSVANASQHVVRLRAAGIVGSRQNGTRRVCSLLDQRARELHLLLCRSCR